MKCIINGGIKKSRKMNFNGTVKELLDKLGICDQIVVVKRNGRIVTEFDRLSDSDTVEIQQVIFGG
jgi:thiamine biosynthesis protein ThiS